MLDRKRPLLAATSLIAAGLLSGTLLQVAKYYEQTVGVDFGFDSMAIYNNGVEPT